MYLSQGGCFIVSLIIFYPESSMESAASGEVCQRIEWVFHPVTLKSSGKEIVLLCSPGVHGVKSQGCSNWEEGIEANVFLCSVLEIPVEAGTPL